MRRRRVVIWSREELLGGIRAKSRAEGRGIMIS
jgi:hypothetical protein